MEAADNGSDRRKLVAVLLIAFGFRCLALGLHADDLTRDRDAYIGIAQGLVECRGLCSPGTSTPTAYRPPLYPLILGVGMMAVSVSFAVAITNVVFGMMTVWATHRIGQRLRLGRASLVAALLVAIDPMLSRYTPQPMTETVCAALVAWMVLAAVHVDRHGTWCEWSVGALFGLLVLCRPTFWPLAGLMAVVGVWNCCRDGNVFARVPLVRGFARRSASTSQGDSALRASPPETSTPLATQGDHPCHATIADGGLSPCVKPSSLSWRVVVATLIVVAPWVIRNQLVFGRPVLTTTHGGYTLLLANNPVFWDEVVDQPWGTVWQGESLARWQAAQDERLARELGPQATEPERDARLNALGHEFIVTQPSRFARAVWHRVRSLWNTVPLGDAGAVAPRWLVDAVGWYYTCLLVAFSIGMVVVACRTERGRWWPLFALVITLQAVHLVYWTNARMRAPLIPVIALFAATLLTPRDRPGSGSSVE